MKNLNAGGKPEKVLPLAATSMAFVNSSVEISPS